MRSSSLAVLSNDVSEIASPPAPKVASATRRALDAELAALAPVLSTAEEQDLLTIAQVALPAGNILPAADQATIVRTHNGLRQAPHAMVLAFRAALNSAQGLVWLRYRRRISNLTSAQALEFLEWLYQGGFARRLLLRSLITPLKIAYYDDPAVYKLIGEPYPHGQGTEADALRRVVPAEQPRYVKERTQSASELSDGETIDCDVVVIGSGAGGAVAAYELAAAGHAVVLLEEGLYFGRADFVGTSFHRQKLLYRDRGITFAFGNTAILVPVGRTVGGTTTVNSGTCYRMPERIFSCWQNQLGLTDYSAEALAPYYDRVEEVLGVDIAENHLLGGGAAAIARGAERLGFRHHPLRRNAPDCDGQGLCCLGCPTDAKRSTNVSYVPMALRAGAQMFVGARADRLIIENGRAVGVEATARFSKSGTEDGARPRFRVRAQAVVVACGSLYTPVFLLNDPVARRALGRSKALGNNLTVHPAVGMFALLASQSHATPAIPQGYAVEEFHDEGILMEGAFVPPEMTAVTTTVFGRRFTETMENFSRLSCFGFMIEDSSSGSVRPGPGRRPLLRYNLSAHDTARLKRGVDLLAQIYFAADAKRILAPVRGFESLESPADLARMRKARLEPADFDLTAYHPLGTARMGVDPNRSIVNQDLAAHDLPGLYICDGSVIPTSPAVNPQVTIMALASRAAQRLAGKLS